LCDHGNPRFSHCTFSGNDHGLRCGLYEGSVTIENTILAFSTDGPGLVLDEDYVIPQLSCCDIYGNAGGDWVGEIADQLSVRDNFSADPLFCDPQQGDYHLWNCSPCARGPCGLVGAYPVGCTDPQAIEPDATAHALADRIRLQYANPNPSAGSSWIHLVVGRSVTAQRMSLEIFDSAGRLVRMLREETPAPGTAAVAWDARDSQGLRVAPGTYFCRLKAGDARDALRLVVLR